MGSWGDAMIDAIETGRRNGQLGLIVEGYDAAASISLEAITEVLDRIEAKIEAGKSLSADEKVLRAELYPIKSKIERKLAEYWQTNYGL
ncbi:hypothetical protein MLP_37470 [Microlunatus phosphovorus NM-1]|uniref:Uncharacterized protein n=1 Tax=Microlunatus phosphovorus (strain ATCC 700054 / DSM 10555 / JCM 9379 / NBRC 101784 / NCIMB 13414 / VKM Ac-1990 / NM-1) TaxID=1032480 RepID=F5XPC1_MICPN|nr:hypothetical protein [Microlunatus phosphovorus]BAK36761.1 hypothetical protein MLP_37470 [Microlunatus phosphovorus NM-1]